MNRWDRLKERAAIRLRTALARRPLRVAFQPSPETAELRYFHGHIDNELAALSSERVVFVPAAAGLSEVDLLLITAQGAELGPYVTDLRDLLPEHALVGLWFWDNHIAATKNLRSAVVADVVFASHAYCATSIVNPASVLVGSVPSCCAQWSATELEQWFPAGQDLPRSNRMLVNYVDYPASWRSALLRSLQLEMPEAQVLLMPPEDRSRYFNQPADQRFREWMGFKTTLILPVTEDLSTRVFDALAAGLVPIVPRVVRDFDAVIPLSLQARLGIVRIDALEPTAIRYAASQALMTFDRMGHDGALLRHRFACERHLLRHRITAMVGALLDFVDGRAGLAWTAEPNPMGLTFVNS